MSAVPVMGGNARARPRVLHLSADFPDDLDPGRTPVIARLVDLVATHFDQSVISLHRRNPRLSDWLATPSRGRIAPSLATRLRATDFGATLTYSAPGKGLFHGTMLRELGHEIAEAATCDGKVPDLIVGHKLTIEGIAAMTAARELGIPFAVTIQGNTDTKIVDARPDLRPLLANVFHEAANVVTFAPWALTAIEARLGRRSGSTTVVPCPLDSDKIIAPDLQGAGLVTVFNLRNWPGKNLRNMAKAVRILADADTPVSLSVIGGGTPRDRSAAEAAVRSSEGVVFDGHIERPEMARRLNRAAGFVLPSRRESFGLVFIEALFAGLPIIYPEGRAIDGLFDDCSFAIPVDPRDPARIAAAMHRLATDADRLKADLGEWQRSPASQQFRREHIAARYAEALASALPGHPVREPTTQASGHNTSAGARGR